MFFFLIDFNSTWYVLHKNKQQYEVEVTPYTVFVNHYSFFK